MSITRNIYGGQIIRELNSRVETLIEKCNTSYGWIMTIVKLQNKQCIFKSENDRIVKK